MSKVVITFGTFDLFHIGHLKMLQRASKLGNKLIVGVSTDKLTLSKKNRQPIYGEFQRKEIIESLKFVDGVFLKNLWNLKENIF